MSFVDIALRPIQVEFTADINRAIQHYVKDFQAISQENCSKCGVHMFTLFAYNNAFLETPCVQNNGDYRMATSPCYTTAII